MNHSDPRIQEIEPEFESITAEAHHRRLARLYRFAAAQSVIAIGLFWQATTAPGLIWLLPFGMGVLIEAFATLIYFHARRLARRGPAK